MTHLDLIDIDGVLADDQHRVHHALAARWAEYFDETAMAADTSIEEGLALVKERIATGGEVQYCTGRREDRRFVTTKWLLDNGYPTLPLLMKERGTGTTLAEYKRQVIEDLLATGEFESITLWDDDPEVVRVIQEAFGETSAVHCVWRIKHPDLVRKAEV